MNRLAPPPASRALNETLSWIEFPRLMLRSPELLSMPRGTGRRTLVFPGFGAGNGSTLVLRRYLTYLGHDVAGWELGVNSGDVLTTLRELVDHVRSQAQRSGAPVALVGWSLGGYLAREVAREAPDCVNRVITLGSPVIGGPKYTQVASMFAARGEDLDLIERLVAERERVPLSVPVTAIYSKFDGVVAWEACIDAHSPHVEHVEVRTTHIGLGFSPDVYRLVAQRLQA